MMSKCLWSSSTAAAESRLGRIDGSEVKVEHDACVRQQRIARGKKAAHVLATFL
jgi:hypothetical protein